MVTLMLMSSVATWKSRAICGSAVTMITPSRNWANRAAAPTSEILRAWGVRTEGIGGAVGRKMQPCGIGAAGASHGLVGGNSPDRRAGLRRRQPPGRSAQDDVAIEHDRMRRVHRPALGEPRGQNACDGLGALGDRLRNRGDAGLMQAE